MALLIMPFLIFFLALPSFLFFDGVQLSLSFSGVTTGRKMDHKVRER